MAYRNFQNRLSRQDYDALMSHLFVLVALGLPTRPFIMNNYWKLIKTLDELEIQPNSHMKTESIRHLIETANSYVSGIMPAYMDEANRAMSAIERILNGDDLYDL